MEGCRRSQALSLEMLFLFDLPSFSFIEQCLLSFSFIEQCLLSVSLIRQRRTFV